MNYRDYRSFLKDELERRISSNSRYSLRAFSKDLRIAPQILSSVLGRKRAISVDVAAKIADRLELNSQEASFFMDLVLYAHTKSSATKKIVEFRVEERVSTKNHYQSLDLEAFKVISDWYHYAILELIQTTGFKNNPKWMASRLGISVHEVQQALERLTLLELIEKDEQGNLKRTNVNVSASYGVPSSAIRKFNRQALQKAIESLEGQLITERDITTMTMAIDPSRLPMAAKMIARFRRKLADFLEQGSRSEVYTFVPALFKLTKNKE